LEKNDFRAQTVVIPERSDEEPAVLSPSQLPAAHFSLFARRASRSCEHELDVRTAAPGCPAQRSSAARHTLGVLGGESGFFPIGNRNSTIGLSMHPARIAELLEPFLGVPVAAELSPRPCHSEGGSAPEESAVLSPSQLQDISTYIDILLRWNARINLTAIRNPEDIVTRHFGESLFAARHLFPRSCPVPPLASVVKDVDFANDQRPRTTDRLADLGSGAGFPGIPIKLWAPHLALTLIESNQKKVAFLREVVRALTLTDIDIFPGRAQSLIAKTPNQNQVQNPGADPAPIQQSHLFDLVTLRAVERFAEILPTAARLVLPRGRLALLIGASQLELARSSLPTVTWQQPLLIPLSSSRIFLLGVAI
jgi:16S rRNA (guanine527-N7)-methyltransferase